MAHFFKKCVGSVAKGLRQFESIVRLLENYATLK